MFAHERVRQSERTKDGSVGMPILLYFYQRGMIFFVITKKIKIPVYIL